MAGGVNLLYAGHGREVDKRMLQAYSLALEDVTDFQVQQAVRYLLKYHTGNYPPTAADVFHRASVYEPSRLAQDARIEANRAALLALTQETEA